MGTETLAYAFAALAAGTAVYTASQAGGPELPQPEKLPQASKSPTVDGARKRVTNNALAGIPSTLLTGAGGVDPAGLSLGKTLLGM